MSQVSPEVSPLLTAFRSGDPAAGDVLLRRFEPWLKLMARLQWESRFHAKFDPSDVVQQAMIEAMKAAAQFRGSSEAEFAAWLRQILAHALAHEIRRYAGTAKRDLDREIPLEQELTQTSQQLGNLLAATGTSPSQQVVKREQSVLLAEVLERLPEDFREVIILRNLEGLSHEEVARRMGRNPGATRMLWVRALARLRQILIPIVEGRRAPAGSVTEAFPPIIGDGV
jgi:RNA polymerase sigma-70 factor, ECF subfamily